MVFSRIETLNLGNYTYQLDIGITDGGHKFACVTSRRTRALDITTHSDRFSPLFSIHRITMPSMNHMRIC